MSVDNHVWNLSIPLPPYILISIVTLHIIVFIVTYSENVLYLPIRLLLVTSVKLTSFLHSAFHHKFELSFV